MNRRLNIRFLLMVVFVWAIAAACGGREAPGTESPQNSELTGESSTPAEPTEEAYPSPGSPEAELTQTSTPPQPNLSTVLLVIDGFTAEKEKEPELSQPTGEFCAVSPEGQIFKGEGLIFKGEGLSWVSLPGVSHGELVFKEISDLLANDYGDPIDTIAGSTLPAGLTWLQEDDIPVWNVSGQNLYLVPVDVEDYDSGVIAERVEVTMNVLHEIWAVDNFVWNMSFGFIPCGVETQLTDKVIDGQIEAIRAENYELEALDLSLYNAVGKEYPALSQDAANSFLYDKIRLGFAYGLYSDYFEPITVPTIADDPFYTLINFFFASEESWANVMPVGSAGNSAYPVPFEPATWPGVVAVSSENQDIAKADYANNGEVMMPDDYKVDDDITVIGTSFAAPRLSYLAAKYLVLGGPLTCSGAMGETRPPFNFDMWLNLSLDSAKTDYCPGFPSLMP